MTLAETIRTRLRLLTSADASFIRDLLNQPSFLRYIGDRQVRTADEAGHFIDSRYMQSYRVFASDVCARTYSCQFLAIAIFRERHSTRRAGADAGVRRRRAIVRAACVAGDVQTRHRVDRWPAPLCRPRLDGDRCNAVVYGDLI